MVITVPRFFVDKENINSTSAVITGDDARHLSRVLRVKPGEELVLCDSMGCDYLCIVENVSDSAVELSVKNSYPSVSEPSVRISLYMALPKGDKMDYIIQKSVELGVYDIFPFSSERCIVKLTDKDKQKKCERWNRIALEAAKQSGRGMIPNVHSPLSFNEMLKSSSQTDLPIFFYEKERSVSLKSVLGSKSFSTVSIIVGPEGGFSDEEAEKIISSGIPSVSLGERILRCETAPGCAISAIMYETDNF